ncbi:hypothetical protein HK100_000834 [Physocladia obscura]|uniref:Uncharacterized protein n=1 Tax=Physocladia obscura TaxID=109957 RepID=A0AAD5XCA7_9FUNG|nr:hypothetical protein HK100_000834 [Physocladia obscura]
MTVTIPSTTVRNQFLKTLPIGTIYKDPRNEHHYEVQEREINTTLSKVGVPYFGSNQPLVIDVPEKWMKMANPTRANINQSKKEQINKLEETVKQLQSEMNENDLMGKSMQIAIHVDSRLVWGSGPVIKELREKLEKQYKMKFEEEPTKFLGINIWHGHGKQQIAINQYDYIKDMIEQYGPVPNNKRFTVPISTEFEHKLNELDEAIDVKKYQELVGSIMHATIT